MNEPDRCPARCSDPVYTRRSRDDGWRCGDSAGHPNGHRLYDSDGERTLVYAGPDWHIPDPQTDETSPPEAAGASQSHERPQDGSGATTAQDAAQRAAEVAAACKTAPGRAFHVGPYRFATDLHRWECSAHGRGVGGYRTPWGAFIALRRWLKASAIFREDA